MSEDKIEPNEQTFATIFECIERTDLINKHSILGFYHREMQNKVTRLLSKLFIYLFGKQIIFNMHKQVIITFHK